MIHNEASNCLDDLIQRENKFSFFQEHILVMLLNSVVDNFSIVVVGDEILIMMVDANNRAALLDDLKGFPLLL